MKKIVLPLLLFCAQTLLAGPWLSDYENFELDNISFEDSLMITSKYFTREAAPGSQGPGGDVVVDDSTEITPFQYIYDSVDNKIAYIGKGRDYTFYLDGQKRVTKMTFGYIRFTNISYGTNSKTIQEFPNDSVLTRHSKEWKYIYNDNGTIDKLIVTSPDWEYNGPIFWGRDNADTIDYSYDSEGRIAGISRITWTTDLFHAYPWKRSIDSLNYAYSTVEGKSVRTITELSKSGNEWITMKDDMQYVSTYNDKGQMILEIARRWDSNNREWDQTYFSETKFVYEDSLFMSSKTLQFYGSVGDLDTIVAGDIRLTYGPNTIIYGVSTAVAGDKKSIANQNVHFANLNDGRVQLVGNTAGIDKISIYSISGRLLRSVSDKSFISLQGIAVNQPLILIAQKGSKPVKVQKMILR